MKTAFLTAAASLFFATFAAHGGERVTLTAEANNEEVEGVSATITLAAGDSAEVLTTLFTIPGANLVISAAGKEFKLQFGNNPVATNITPHPNQKHIFAGPATLKVTTPPGKAMATLEITRAGTASGPVPIPQEAGTTWQVILEASSDLVNWTAVQPGDYPSSTPQKYFRTRLVRRP